MFQNEEKFGAFRGYFLVGGLLFTACASKQIAQPKLVEEKKFKAGTIYATPVEELWDGAIHKALLKAKDELGIDYEWSESVGYSDFERVLREYADKGPEVIFSDAFSNEESARRVATDYPNIAFVFGSGLGPADPNFAVFDDWIHEPAYLCGMIAGKLTKSNIIGVVGGYSVPEVNRIINAYIFEAKDANPNVEVKVTFIGSWFDPPEAKEAAIAQIEAGSDVMYGEKYGVIDTCKERKVYEFRNIDDQNYLVPDWVITSAVGDMYPCVNLLNILLNIKETQIINRIKHLNYFGI